MEKIIKQINEEFYLITKELISDKEAHKLIRDDKEKPFYCTHYDQNGFNALRSTGIDNNYKCELCGETFNVIKSIDVKISENNINDVIQSIILFRSAVLDFSNNKSNMYELLSHLNKSYIFDLKEKSKELSIENKEYLLKELKYWFIQCKNLMNIPRGFKNGYNSSYKNHMRLASVPNQFSNNE